MKPNESNDFIWQTEQFADIRILRYRADGFNQLNLGQKLMVWHLYRAALTGRDIIYDQNYKYNLIIRSTLETIFENAEIDKTDQNWLQFEVFLKRLWFSNGIHHHYSTEKLIPGFDAAFFTEAFNSLHESQLHLLKGQTKKELLAFMLDQLFNPEVAPKRVQQEDGRDLVRESACNFYENISQEEAEKFYADKTDEDPQRPVSWGLNSKLVKTENGLKEQIYFADGRYGKAIRKIVIQLEKARQYAENEQQRGIICKLIDFYESGNLKTFDEYSILWVQDTDSKIDFVNGFVEVYGDPLGYHGSWQSVVSIRDEEASERFGQISALAGWFEAQSPIAAQHKRSDAAGITYKVIQAIIESGDNAPSSPIGVNLPNADWIRSEHGSKSVSIGNIEDAYENASKSNGSLEAFFLPDQQERIKKYGALASKLHTGLHEVIGHGSGQLMPGVGTPKETLKSYSNTIEEARADLVALYFITDPKMMEVGLCPSPETGKAEYDSFMVNGLLRQLVRVEKGKNIEESHMRNRQLIAAWAFEKGKADKVVELLSIDGETFVRINNYEKLREIFGRLLSEVQRIKSEGDFEAARQLVENYGVKVDIEIHTEVLKRWNKLNIAPFAGFIQPRLEVEKKDGRIVDVFITYPDDFKEQMLYYSHNYAYLPIYND
jgi:dipeptidyl-peptidase-3